MSSKFRQLPRDSFLARFLSQHDDPLQRGFITRIDRSPVAHKRLAFLKALLLNVLVFLFISALAAVTIARDFLSPLPIPVKLAFCITQDAVIGAAIFVLVRSTTVPFFLGECQLRFLYGFCPSEIIIRKPPPMVLALEVGMPENQRMEHYWRTAIRAVNPDLLYSNVNAILSSEYWTLEYRTILDAMRQIEESQFDQDALEFAIWKQDNGVWNVFELWRMHEIMTDQQEVAMFKSFLSRSGKEGLLAIWQDMLSRSPPKKLSERSSPRFYQAMVDKFAREGLDYETLWSYVSSKNRYS